jgi:glycosyltransferase involved in cell wall biosynthesis
MRLGLVGAGYFPRVTAGEKNFYYRLVPHLQDLAEELVVLSVNDSAELQSEQPTPAGAVPIYNFVRPIDGRRHNRHFGTTNGVAHYHHVHAPGREMVEKTATIVANSARIRRIVRDHDLQWMYFLDNFGPGMRYARRAFGCKIAFAAANYQPHGTMHDHIQGRFLSHLDLLVTYSNAYADHLQRGLPGSHIEVVRWGISPDHLLPLDRARREVARQSLGLSSASLFVLWTGFIQQVKEADFRRTIRVAHAVRAKRPDIDFVFCLKPEWYRPEFDCLSRDGVQVVNGVPNFLDVVGAADLLLSPVGELRSTVSPPLTWLEAMSMGTPVLTTAVGGADEVISPSSGYVARDYEEVETILMSMPTGGPPSEMRGEAREAVRAQHDVKKAALRYSELFRATR